MKNLFIIFVSILLFSNIAIAQQRVVDATDNSPISAASIFDFEGNLIGITLSDGVIGNIPESAYPITLRCVGYEQLLIENPHEKILSMIPAVYELEEVVIVPVERNMMKQTLYVREYFSIETIKDTVTIFMEHMADRFVPAARNVKTKVKHSVRLLGSKQYSRFKADGEDTVTFSTESEIPSMLHLFDLNPDEIKAPESFKNVGNINKYHSESGKSGMSVIMQQNANTFTTVKDLLAETSKHKSSPFLLKLIGFSMQFNQLYTTNAFNVNEQGIYLQKDLIESGFVMEADGKGKLLRKLFETDKGILMRAMIELYVVDKDYLSEEEAQSQRNVKPENIEFIIPHTVPPLNDATKKLIESAKSN